MISSMVPARKKASLEIMTSIMRTVSLDICQSLQLYTRALRHIRRRRTASALAEEMSLKRGSGMASNTYHERSVVKLWSSQRG